MGVRRQEVIAANNILAAADGGQVTFLNAVIIGAGFSGMYMLHSLRDKLDLNVIVFEAGDGVGGTWYWNRYPGARCDSDSYVYCYTFDKNLLQEWDWSERYPEQDEILRYLEHCAERFDLKPDIQFGNTGPQSPSVLSNMRVSIEQHVEWITECIAHMRRTKLATIEAIPQAQDAWGAHVAEVVNSSLMPGINSWYMGANIAGKPRRFLPYLGPEGVGGYRRKCDEVAEKGYEGFLFASQGQGGTVHPIAAE